VPRPGESHTHFEDAKPVLEASEELGEAMPVWTSARWTKKICSPRAAGKRCGAAGLWTAILQLSNRDYVERNAATPKNLKLEFSPFRRLRGSRRDAAFAGSGNREVRTVAELAQLRRADSSWRRIHHPTAIFYRKKGCSRRSNNCRQACGIRTCAGAILAGQQSRKPRADSLGLLEMTVLFATATAGSWPATFSSDRTKLKSGPMEMVFIRGPIIEQVGAAVEVLAEYAGSPPWYK